MARHRGKTGRVIVLVLGTKCQSVRTEITSASQVVLSLSDNLGAGLHGIQHARGPSVSECARSELPVNVVSCQKP